MTDRNLFDTLYSNQVNITSSVIDLTGDIEESDSEDEIIFPDSFSSSVGKILNEKSISAVLSNIEVFYKSQIEYLEDNRYEKPIPVSNSLCNFDDDLQNSNKLIDKFDLLPINTNDNMSVKNSAKQSFSSYYFIKQTFNCPMVLIDHLINTMSDMKLKGDENDFQSECPKHIEIDTVFETDKSNIITKRDLRLLSFYKCPKPKKPRISTAPVTINRGMKSKSIVPPMVPIYRKEIHTPLTNSFEVIEISDSEEEIEDNEMMESNSITSNTAYNDIQEVWGC